MIYVNLIESVKQIKNQVQVIATVEDENGNAFLGETEFFLKSTEILPEDEDELSYFIEDLDLEWKHCNLVF